MTTAAVVTNMELSDLIQQIDSRQTSGKLTVEVGGISTDSRGTGPGDVFVAVRGTKVDGHDYVADAIENGAVGVFSEKEVETNDVPNVVVDDTAKVLAELSARFYGQPASRLFMCGITGTNGKSSTAHLYRAIIEESDWGKIGIVGTLGHGVGGELTRTVHTTPDAVELHRTFKDIVDQGCHGVVMEVSSHAVRQHRVWGLDFDIGILTNVTHDHLDYHGTLENYRAVKKEFCDSLVDDRRKKPRGTLVYSNDDPVAREIGENFPGPKISVGSSSDSDVYTSEVDISLDGTSFKLHLGKSDEIEIRMSLLGSFCAVNSALAAAGAHATGIDSGAIKAGLETIDRIPGRFEAIGGRGKPVVVIDYCHTPDAMERILLTCRGLNPQKITTVFGCGGDRDRKKRPMLGAIAQKLSDFCYVTMDNPRTEKLDAIIDDILGGMDSDADDHVVDLNRSRAIYEAIINAGERDVVALLGKGHEDYQIVGQDRLPFSDRSEAEGALRKWRAR